MCLQKSGYSHRGCVGWVLEEVQWCLRLSKGGGKVDSSGGCGNKSWYRHVAMVEVMDDGYGQCT